MRKKVAGKDFIGLYLNKEDSAVYSKLRRLIQTDK